MPQKRPSKPSWRAPLVAGFLLLAGSVASAQWVWKEGERKVFSDTAPPASVPEKNIIKRPGGGSAAMPLPATVAPANAETSSAATPPQAAAPQLPTVDKELEAKKKQAEQTEAARNKAEEQRLAQARTENCNRAKQARATLDSGVRLATTNAKGEREIMDDKARATEAKRLDDLVRSDCGPMPKSKPQ